MHNYTPVKAFKLRDYRLSGWREKFVGRAHYRDLVADPDWKKGWISFDSVTFNPDDENIYCGLNSIDGDLLYRFDPRCGKFTGLGTQRWADEFDVKIHRTLLHNRGDRCFYFGIGLLHDIDQQYQAKGGKLVRYDLAHDRYEILGIPVPLLYIQSIAADFRRGLIYGLTFPGEAFFMFDLGTGKSKTLGYVGNSLFFAQPHNPVVDAGGWFWGTYAETRGWDEMLSPKPIRLFKFHPEGERFVWFDYGLPRKDDPEQLLPDPEKPADAVAALDQTRHAVDYGFCDSMIFDGSRYIYAGTVAGVLCRIDTWTDKVEKIAHVIASARLPGLAIGEDGTVYGAGGMNGYAQIVRWKPGAGQLDSFFHLHDPEIGDGPARIHEMAVDRNHCLYLGENDNHERSSYLWTAKLD